MLAHPHSVRGYFIAHFMEIIFFLFPPDEDGLGTCVCRVPSCSQRHIFHVQVLFYFVVKNQTQNIELSLLCFCGIWCKILSKICYNRSITFR